MYVEGESSLTTFSLFHPQFISHFSHLLGFLDRTDCIMPPPRHPTGANLTSRQAGLMIALFLAVCAFSNHVGLGLTAKALKPVTDKVTTHTYQTMYGRFLSTSTLLTPKHLKPSVKFLEIGLGCGASPITIVHITPNSGGL
jgi:hypothetical protein